MSQRKSIVLALPYPPSVNNYLRANGRKRFIAERVKLFRAEVKVICFNARCPQFTGRLAMHIELRPPTKRLMDIDNALKAPLDALQHAGVYADDSQIDDLRIVRGPVCEGGELIVSVAEINERSQPCG